MNKAAPTKIANVTQGSAGLAALIVVLCFIILMTVPGLSGLAGTTTIGLVSIGAMYFGLRIKYNGKIFFNAEVIFLTGVAVQYLFAPMLLRWITNDFTYYLDKDITTERWEVKEGYCGAMLIVMGYCAAFFVGSSFFSVKRLHRDEDGRPLQKFTEGSMWFNTALLVVLWVTRLILLKSGSYYHLNRSDFQNEDWRYSMLSQLDNNLGILVAVHLFSKFLIEKASRFWLVGGYLGIDFFWNFASGSRERALTVGVMLIMTYILCRNKLPVRLILPSIIASLFLIGFMDYYRYASLSSTEASKIELSGIGSALSTAKSQSEGNGILNTSITGIERLSDLESICAIYLWVPSSVDYLRGETYLSIIANLVPRFFWPDKPQTILPLNKWFYVNEGGTCPTTTMGEGFLNFGWGGVIFAGLFTALLLQMTESFLLRRSGTPVFMAFYVWFLIGIARLHTQPLGFWVSIMIKTVMFFGLASYLLNFRLDGSPARAQKAGAIVKRKLPLTLTGQIIAEH